MFNKDKTPEYFAWLKTIKVGDVLPFMLPTFGTDDRWTMLSVTHVTPKSIMVGSQKYERETGRGISKGIRYTHLQPMTDEIRAKMGEADGRRRALNRIEHESDIRFRNVATDKLMAIAAILGPIEKDSQ